MPWSLCQHSTCVTNTPTHLYGHIYLKRSSLRYFSLYYKSKLQSGEQCSHPNPAIKPQCTKQPNTNEDQTFSSALGYIHTVLKAQLQQHQLVSAKKKNHHGARSIISRTQCVTPKLTLWWQRIWCGCWWYRWKHHFHPRHHSWHGYFHGCYTAIPAFCCRSWWLVTRKETRST